jgi:hypothetical protein
LTTGDRPPTFFGLSIMDATRARFSFEPDDLAERLHQGMVAAIVLLALVLVALLVREIRVATRESSTNAAAAPSAPAAAGVSVGTLVLAADRQIRVGDAQPDAVERLAAQTLITRTEERGPFGAREVRSYAAFTLVFEPLEPAGQSRVAAIYVQ